MPATARIQGDAPSLALDLALSRACGTKAIRVAATSDAVGRVRLDGDRAPVFSAMRADLPRRVRR